MKTSKKIHLLTNKILNLLLREKEESEEKGKNGKKSRHAQICLICYSMLYTSCEKQFTKKICDLNYESFCVLTKSLTFFKGHFFLKV